VAIRLHWYLPTNGDSREIVGSGDDSQFVTTAALTQTTHAAELSPERQLP
jgi:hypothetical protein